MAQALALRPGRACRRCWGVAQAWLRMASTGPGPFDGLEALEVPQPRSALPSSDRYYCDVPRAGAGGELRCFPSVTTILEHTRPPWAQTALLKWAARLQEEMGEAGFAAHRTALKTNGSRIHGLVEAHLTGAPVAVPPELAQLWASVEPQLEAFRDVQMLEFSAVHPTLGYAGRADCIARYDGQLTLVDWKTTSKRRPNLRSCFDSGIQVAAYHLAVRHQPDLYGLGDEPLSACLVMINADGSPADVLVMSAKDIEEYTDQWLKRLKAYSELWPPPSLPNRLECERFAARVTARRDAKRRG